MVAGPPACGKTWIIDNLYAGNLGELAGALGLGAVGEWEFTHGLRISRGRFPHSPKAILHYDFWRAVAPADGRAEFNDDTVLRWLGAARQLMIVTCVTCADTIRKRLRRRLARYVFDKMYALARGRSPHLYSPLRQARFLAQPSKLETLYRDWFAYCANAGFKDHWHLNTTHNVSIERLPDTPGNTH